MGTFAPPLPPQVEIYRALYIQCKICISGPTDKHLHIVFESPYGELQEAGSKLSELWRRKSIKFWAGEIGGICDPFATPEEAGGIYSGTRLSVGKRPRCSHGGDYLPRCLSMTIDVIGAYFLQLITGPPPRPDCGC